MYLVIGTNYQPLCFFLNIQRNYVHIYLCFAHFRFRPRQFSVKVGEWNLADSDTYSAEFRVVLITAHPDFKANGFYSDVALFKLDQPVRFSE